MVFLPCMQSTRAGEGRRVSDGDGCAAQRRHWKPGRGWYRVGSPHRLGRGPASCARGARGLHLRASCRPQVGAGAAQRSAALVGIDGRRRAQGEQRHCQVRPTGSRYKGGRQDPSDPSVMRAQRLYAAQPAASPLHTTSGVAHPCQWVSGSALPSPRLQQSSTSKLAHRSRSAHPSPRHPLSSSLMSYEQALEALDDLISSAAASAVSAGCSPDYGTRMELHLS